MIAYAVQSSIEKVLRAQSSWGTNTRLQNEQIIQLSTYFPKASVILYWVPSGANLADALTKISRTPVKSVNRKKYRNGLVNPDIYYTDLHREFLRNWYYKIENGKCEYRDIKQENIVTCDFEDKYWKTRQEKEKIMKELLEGK